MKKNHTSNMLKLAQGGFYVNALIWLVFGVLSLVLALQTGAALRWVYAVLMLANAAVLAWFGVQITSGRKWVFFLGILYVALNAVLSITDQFGWIDALVLLLNLCLLGLLFVTRQRMTQGGA